MLHCSWVSPQVRSYVGCLADYYFNADNTVVDRNMPGPSMKDPQLTTDRCISYCSAQGAPLAGTMNAQYCICSFIAPVASSIVANSSCNVRCLGNTTEFCGGTYYYRSLWATGVVKWGGIYLSATSVNNQFEYVTIEHAGIESAANIVVFLSNSISFAMTSGLYIYASSPNYLFR